MRGSVTVALLLLALAVPAAQAESCDAGQTVIEAWDGQATSSTLAPFRPTADCKPDVQVAAEAGQIAWAAGRLFGWTTIGHDVAPTLLPFDPDELTMRGGQLFARAGATIYRVAQNGSTNEIVTGLPFGEGDTYRLVDGAAWWFRINEADGIKSTAAWDLPTATHLLPRSDMVELGIADGFVNLEALGRDWFVAHHQPRPTGLEGTREAYQPSTNRLRNVPAEGDVLGFSNGRLLMRWADHNVTWWDLSNEIAAPAKLPFLDGQQIGPYWVRLRGIPVATDPEPPVATPTATKPTSTTPTEPTIVTIEIVTEPIPMPSPTPAATGPEPVRVPGPGAVGLVLLLVAVVAARRRA